MPYFRYSFSLDRLEDSEPLLGLLSQLPFESFEEDDYNLHAYLRKEDMTDTLDDEVMALRKHVRFQVDTDLLGDENWNELWESNFEPIRVENFVGVRAEFHPSFGDVVQHELLIQPKMAFGTGHHETTHLMMGYMEGMNFAGKRVLDYGCGTGILAILAARLGAPQPDAIDIEEPAYENTQENARVNGVELWAACGDLSLVSDRSYDIILANINRNVILDSIPSLSGMLPKGGQLLLSGLLEQDRPVVEKALPSDQWKVDSVRQRNQWIALLVQKI